MKINQERKFYCQYFKFCTLSCSFEKVLKNGHKRPHNMNVGYNQKLNLYSIQSVWVQNTAASVHKYRL